jgi:hypothetical protein
VVASRHWRNAFGSFEARGHHKADIAFGEWCEANGFGENVINHQTRAAAIAMGLTFAVISAVSAARNRFSAAHNAAWKRFLVIGAI